MSQHSTLASLSKHGRLEAHTLVGDFGHVGEMQSQTLVVTGGTTFGAITADSVTATVSVATQAISGSTAVMTTSMSAPAISGNTAALATSVSAPTLSGSTAVLSTSLAAPAISGSTAVLSTSLAAPAISGSTAALLISLAAPAISGSTAALTTSISAPTISGSTAALTTSVSAPAVSAATTLLVPVVDVPNVAGPVAGNVALDSNDQTLRFYTGTQWITTAPLVPATSADLALYVSSAGSDVTGTGLIGAPFATLQHALNEGARIGYLESLTINLLTSLDLGSNPSLYVSPTLRPQLRNRIYIRGATTDLITGVTVTGLALWGPQNTAGTAQFQVALGVNITLLHSVNYGTYIINEQDLAADIAHPITRNNGGDVYIPPGNDEDAALMVRDTGFGATTMAAVRNSHTLAWDGALTVNGVFDQFTFRWLDLGFGDNAISTTRVASVLTSDPQRTLHFENCDLHMITDPGGAEPFLGMPGNVVLTRCVLLRKPGVGNDFPFVLGGPGKRCTLAECVLMHPTMMLGGTTITRCHTHRASLFAAPNTDALVLVNNRDANDIELLVATAEGVNGAETPLMQVIGSSVNMRDTLFSAGNELSHGLEIRDATRAVLGGKMMFQAFSGVGPGLAIHSGSSVTNDIQQDTELNFSLSGGTSNFIELDSGTMHLREDTSRGTSVDISGIHGNNSIVLGPLSHVYFDNGGVVPTANSLTADVVLPSGAARTFAVARARVAITDYSEAQTAGQLFGTIIIT